MKLVEVLNRAAIDEILKLLPKWQKEYFAIEEERINKSFLINYIASSFAQIFVTNYHFAFLIGLLNEDEVYAMSSMLFEKKSIKNTNKQEMIEVVINENLRSNLFVKLRDYFGVTRINNESTSVFLGYSQAPKKRFFELLDYQVFIKEQLLNFLEENNLLGRVLVHMPTGTGKTKTSMHTIVNYFQNTMKSKGLILWIAHTNTLLEQAEETFDEVWSHLGKESIPVYRVYDKFDIISNSDEITGVAFCGISKLISLYKNNTKSYSSIRNSVQLIIFDEAHKSTALETQKVVENLMSVPKGRKNRQLIGLTATPGRNVYSSDDNQRLAEMYEKRIIKIDSKIVEQLRKSEIQYLNQSLADSEIIKYFQERQILSRIIREEIEYQENNQPIYSKKSMEGTDYDSKFLNQISTNIARNRKIVTRLIELSLSNYVTIFFACTVEHGRFISSLLSANGIKVAEVYGETSTNERQSIIERFRNGEISVLVNCGVLTTGFDSTNISCVFIARPTKSVVLYSQMIGRGLRGPKMGGNKTCLLIDMKDNLERFSDENEAFTFFEEFWR